MNEGGCFCGAVRYRITGAPVSSAICHCESCRRASGAPSVAWITVGKKCFELIQGVPISYRSSPGVVRQFCGSCGSALTYETSKHPDGIDITTATLDEPNRFPPDVEVWLEDRISWEPVSANLNHCLKSSLD
jgi:hypothetical protein